MPGIIDKLKNNISTRSVEPVDESAFIRFRTSIIITAICIVVGIILTICSAIAMVFTIGDNVGYSVAIIPAIILILEKPISFFLKIIKLFKTVEKHYTDLNMGRFMIIYLVIIISLVVTIILAIVSGWIIYTTAFGASSQLSQVPIQNQKIVIICILGFWLMEKMIEISFNYIIEKTGEDIIKKEDARKQEQMQLIVDKQKIELHP